MSGSQKKVTVTVYGAIKGEKFPNGCKFCDEAKRHLDEHGIDYDFVNIFAPENGKVLDLFKAHHETVPQVYVDGEHYGDSVSVVQLVRELHDPAIDIGDLDL